MAAELEAVLVGSEFAPVAGPYAATDASENVTNEPVEDVQSMI